MLHGSFLRFITLLWFRLKWWNWELHIFVTFMSFLICIHFFALIHIYMADSLSTTWPSSLRIERSRILITFSVRGSICIVFDHICLLLIILLFLFLRGGGAWSPIIDDISRSPLPFVMLEELLDEDTSALEFDRMAEPDFRGITGRDRGMDAPSNLIINYLPLDIYSVDLKVSLRYLTWIE